MVGHTDGARLRLHDASRGRHGQRASLPFFFFFFFFLLLLLLGLLLLPLGAGGSGRSLIRPGGALFPPPPPPSPPPFPVPRGGATDGGEIRLFGDSSAEALGSGGSNFRSPSGDPLFY